MTNFKLNAVTTRCFVMLRTILSISNLDQFSISFATCI